MKKLEVQGINVDLETALKRMLPKIHAVVKLFEEKSVTKVDNINSDQLEDETYF